MSAQVIYIHAVVRLFIIKNLIKAESQWRRS